MGDVLFFSKIVLLFSKGCKKSTWYKSTRQEHNEAPGDRRLRFHGFRVPSQLCRISATRYGQCLGALLRYACIYLVYCCCLCIVFVFSCILSHFQNFIAFSCIWWPADVRAAFRFISLVRFLLLLLYLGLGPGSSSQYDMYWLSVRYHMYLLCQQFQQYPGPKQCAYVR